MKGDVNPYNPSKSSPNNGTYHGSGLPTKYGLRKGTFAECTTKKVDSKKDKPPRKFN